jgi:uncharacterized membrane protein
MTLETVASKADPITDFICSLKLADFAIDVVAIRIGFWNWANGGEYYGVPLSNFWGWLVVAFCFSLFVRLVRIFGIRPGTFNCTSNRPELSVEFSRCVEYLENILCSTRG